MSDTIKDGTGQCYEAKVDIENKLQVRAVQRSELSHSITEGKTWNIGTGFLTLASDTSSALLYIKNTGAVKLTISAFVLLTKPSTDGASEDGIIEIYRNPNAGTIITDEASVEAVNNNFSSAATPIASLFSGGQGKTASGHDATIRSKVSANSRLLLPIEISMDTGASLCVLYTPPTGNTSMEVEAIFELFEEHV